MKPAMQMPMNSNSMPAMSMGTAMPMGMMMPMTCHMSCQMTDKGMKCTMTPGEDITMDMMKACCSMMTMMMKADMPCMMTCNGMPMMMCCGMPMMPKMTCEMGAQGMMCMMMPCEGMTMDMLKMCSDMMMKMMACGMPVMLTCGSMPIMACMQ